MRTHPGGAACSHLANPATHVVGTRPGRAGKGGMAARALAGNGTGEGVAIVPRPSVRAGGDPAPGGGGEKGWRVVVG
jgi:hypothetical protein